MTELLRARAIGLALALLALSAGGLSAQDFDREVAFLTIPIGARLVGMGRAGTAIAGEFQAMRWNPAVIGAIRGVAPLVSLYEGPLDFKSSQFAVAVPVGGIGVFGLSAEIQSFGEITINDGSGTVPLGVISPSNLVLSAAYAHSFADRLALGVTGKWIDSRLVGDLNGSTFALDAGVLGKPLAGVPLRVGVSALNLGPGLKLGDDPDAEADPLPSRVRFGLAYDPVAHIRGNDDYQLLISLDFEHAWRDMSTASQYIGAELGVRKIAYIRAGYISETLIETNTGIAFGFGLALGAFSVDLAFEQGVNQLGNETYVSLGALF